VSDPRPAENFTLLPVTHLIPVPGHKPDPKDYCCPCYKTSTRSGALSTTGMSTNYVLNIELPCRDGDVPSKWVLAGTALLTNLND
jgi:dynein heavy chain